MIALLTQQLGYRYLGDWSARAVMHRVQLNTHESTNAPVRVYWYDDRIEISNPGGRYGNVTILWLGCLMADLRRSTCNVPRVARIDNSHQ